MIRCPICAEKMNLENNLFLCQHCGYTVPMDTPIQSPKISFESNHLSSNKRAKYNWNFIIKLLGIFFFLCLISSIHYAFLQVRKLETFPQSNIETYTNPVVLNEKVEETVSLPKSALFIEFIEQVFQKDISAIHPEDLECITSIRIYRDKSQKKCIEYRIEDSASKTILFFTSFNYDYADLSCFIGLKNLHIEDGSGIIQKGDLDGLFFLQEFVADKTPSELMDILPNPENLKVLGIYNSFFLKSFEGIEAFKNLTSLSIDRCDLKTLDGLEQLPFLKKLELLNSNQIEDFSALYQLHGLEFLSIESSSLKEIGFIENMPNLVSLSIKDANLLQIESLSSCAESLKSLSLWHIYKVEDYQVLDSLHQLTYLQLELPYEYPPLSFSHMKELTELSLCRVSDIHTIATAPNLQKLKLDGCNGERFDALIGLSNLKCLEISNLSGYFISLEPLKQLTGLETLRFDDCRIYADLEGVLTLPNLKEFAIKNCSIGFNFSNLPENTNLTTLKIEDTIFAKILPKGDPEYGQIKKENSYQLSNYSDALKKFPNLIELTLIGNELDSIAFAAELKNLQILDISNNYITDLTPLTQLSALQTVVCFNNPIVYMDGVKATIVQ